VTTDLYREVIVGTDGSPTAARAVRAAASIAAACDAPLTIVSSWYRRQADPPALSEEASYPGGSAAGHEAQHAAEATSDAAAIARSLGLEDITQQTPQGSAADALVELAEGRPGSLVVVGTVGLGSRGERMIGGNVPHQLTHHCPRDLLLIRSSDRQRDDVSWSRVALATDGSPTAGVAVEHGLAFVEAVGAKATLITVARDEAHGRALIDRARDQVGAPDLDGDVAVSSHVADALVEAAQDHDLLVIGNKGMSGPSRLLGSVSNRITHEVPTDLLLVNTSR
jgi:nucleotide-binding universal stress UspA family protein